jgi:hypothetical protein
MIFLANPTQIRNVSTRLFAKTGKPESCPHQVGRNGKTIEENRAATVDPGIILGGDP